jgi:hypothetical protein
MPQIWLTLEELGEMLKCDPAEVRRAVLEHDWPRRRSGDGLTRVKLSPALAHDFMLKCATRKNRELANDDGVEARLAVRDSIKEDRTHAGLSHFLLIFREQLHFGAMVVQARTLADALLQAAHAGLDAPNSFRLGQQIDAELVRLVPPAQVGRILSRAEAKELCDRFADQDRQARRRRSPRLANGDRREDRQRSPQLRRADQV